MKRLLKLLAIFIVLLAGPAYYALVLHSPTLQAANYPLNIGEIRGLANSLTGEHPSQIRVEHVADFEFAQAMVVAGAPWKGTQIPILSYQLVFSDRHIIVDTAMASTAGIPDFMVKGFDQAAYERMSSAMESASDIVITHEHSDHIGGILAHGKLESLLPAVKLTEEQLNHPDRMAPLKIPAGVFDAYQALEYVGLHALAPGVVLIKSPGHTPGSQMVFIQLADGREVLLLGDVAWQHRSLETQRERPLFMTALIKEDRQAVLAQFQSIAKLAAAEPKLHIIPGHDAAVLKSMLESKILMERFLPAS